MQLPTPSLQTAGAATPAGTSTPCGDHETEVSSATAQDLIVGRARSYITRNLERNISLEELASHAGCDKFRMIRVFRRLVGTTPHAYLLAARVERAAELLKAGEPAAEVASSVGFVDQSHLIRFFKRHAGTTPKRFLLCA